MPNSIESRKKCRPTAHSVIVGTEAIYHFVKVCPKFHHARTAAHNRVLQALFKLPQRYALADWKRVEETPMYLTGLRLQEEPTAELQ